MNRIPSTVKTMALAVALALPAVPAFAASMSDIVTTREDQDVHQQFGRDSVYAMQTRQPAQTESHVSSDSGIGKFFAGVGAAGASAWHKVTGVFEPGSHTAVAQQQPQWYGRAGGYVGTGQLALLERAGPAQDVSQPVTAGEAVAIAPAEREIRYPAATESQLYGRSEDEDRFSHATGTVPPASSEVANKASEPVTTEQPVIANDVQAPAATEIQPYGREPQPYGRNEDQLSAAEVMPPAAVPSEPTEQPLAPKEPTMFDRDQDKVYDSAAAGAAGSSPAAGESQTATDQAAATSEAQQPSDEAASATRDESLTVDEGSGRDDAQADSVQSMPNQANQEGAGEAAQSAPSPDSVTVLDEEESRLGEQSRDQALRSEPSGGRL